MYKLALALAISFCGSACSAAPALSVDCSKGAQASDGTTVVCGDNSGNIIGSPSANTAPPPATVDAGADSAPAAQCPSPPLVPWFRADGTKALWPNFVAPSDGAEWVYPLPAETTDVYSILVSQHGNDAPSAPANLAAVVYDNETGQARASTDVLDSPTGEKHKLSVRPPESNSGDTVMLVLQAPSASQGADAGLWVWSVPACD